VDKDYIRFLEMIAKNLESLGFSVVLPHKDEGEWGKRYIEPEEIARICLNLVLNSDIIVAFPKFSRGVHLEIGFALAHKKRVIICVKKGEDVSIFIPGVEKVGDVSVVEYNSKEEVTDKLKEIFHISK